MSFSLIELFLACFILIFMSLLLFNVYTKLTSGKSLKFKDVLPAFGLVSLIFSLPLLWIFTIVFASVTVVSGQGNDLDYETRYCVSEYDGNKVKAFKNYIFNKSNTTLRFYSQTYSTHSMSGFGSHNYHVIEPKSFEQVEHSPDYYFYEPKTVRSKSSMETKWILDKY